MRARARARARARERESERARERERARGRATEGARGSEFSHDEVRALKVKGHATERNVEAGRTSHLCKRRNDFADTFAKKVQIRTSPLFASPRQLWFVRPWPSKRHVGRPKRTFCSGSGCGTTPGLLRHDHGYGPRKRDSSESERRRLLRRLQFRFLSCFLVFSLTFLARQSPRSSHIQRAQLAIGTSFRCWRPSFGQRHHLKCGAVYWERADALCRQCSEFSGGQSVAVAQIEVWAFSQQTLPWLDSPSTFVGSTLDEAATLVAQLESCEAGLGSNGHGAHQHLKSNGWPLRQRC